MLWWQKILLWIQFKKMRLDLESNNRPQIEMALDALEFSIRERFRYKRAIEHLVWATMYSAYNKLPYDLRERAAKALPDCEYAIDLLIRELNNPDTNVAHNAAYGLSVIGSEQVVVKLLAAFNDSEVQIRQKAASVLGLIKSEQAVEPLLVALNDPDALIRAAAARALGLIKNERAVEPLITALNDPKTGVRQAAIEALGKIGDIHALEPLIEITKQVTDPWLVDSETKAELFRAEIALCSINDPKAYQASKEVRKVLEEVSRISKTSTKEIEQNIAALRFEEQRRLQAEDAEKALSDRLGSEAKRKAINYVTKGAWTDTDRFQRALFKRALSGEFGTEAKKEAEKAAAEAKMWEDIARDEQW